MTNADFTSMDQLKDPVSHFVFDTMTKTFRLPRGLAFRLIRCGARDHARTPMQWDDGVNAGFNAGETPWQCLNSAYPEINVRRDLNAERSVYRFYQQLLAFRRENPVALRGETRLHLPKSRRMIVYSRELEGRRLLIVGNFSARSRKFRLPSGFHATRLAVRLTNYDRQQLRREMTLRPYEAIVFEEI